MKRRWVVYVLLFSLPFYFLSCSSLTQLQRESWNNIPQQSESHDEFQVVTKTGYRYNFFADSLTIAGDTLFGSGYRESAFEDFPFDGAIPLYEINKIEVYEFDLKLTLIFCGVIAAMAFVLVLIGSEGLKDTASGVQF